MRRVLVTGATGFVGRAVQPALLAAGWQVRALSRHEPTQRPPAGVEWVRGDVGDAEAVARVLTGCTSALYLVHAMGDGDDFQRRELAAAGVFARAAAAAGVGRIVYLGGVAPAGQASHHLASRLAVGEVLRAGAAPALELRASMIVGPGSISWQIVRDLAARLPFMVLPAWLASRTQPVAIDDVVAALVRAVELPPGGSSCHDLPGPELLSYREILATTARVMGLSPAWLLEVPLLSPRLSSLWLRFVTRADWPVARALVAGLRHDLIARDDHFWHHIGHPRRLAFAEAARLALAAEHRERPPGVWGAVERLRHARGAA